MACERWREMISAQLDGEDDPADRPLVDEHLAGCADCRRWLDQAALVNRLTRTRAAAPVPDLTAAIMAAAPQPAPPDRTAAIMAAAPQPARPRALLSRGRLYLLLAVVGAVQLILGLTQVGGGAFGAHVHTGLTATPGHLWHESAAWNVALGAGFLFIALHRTRPGGLVPMLTAFVGMLLLLSINDLSAGRVDAGRLVSHGFVLAGYVLVVALARIRGESARPPGPQSDDSGSDGWGSDGWGSDGSGWRVRFDDQGGEPTPTLPPLRLVPPGPATATLAPRGPATARHDHHRAA